MTQLQTETAIQRAPQRKNSPLSIMAAHFNIEPAMLHQTLCNTVIKPTDRHTPTNEEVAAFVIVANQYGLNPFTRQIHAFADPRKGVIPIVGIDGWAHIVNGQKEFDGVEFEYEEEGGKIVSCTCTMHVKGRAHPVKVTEYLAECKRDTPPWTGMPRRMLRHKAFMQAARLAFSIAGIHDEDEAKDIVTNTAYDGPIDNTPVAPVKDRVKQALATAKAAPAPVFDREPEDAVESDGGEFDLPESKIPFKRVESVAKPPEAAKPVMTPATTPSEAKGSAVAFTGKEAAAAQKTWDILCGLVNDMSGLEGAELRATVENWITSINADWSIQSLTIKTIRHRLQELCADVKDWKQYAPTEI